MTNDPKDPTKVEDDVIENCRWVTDFTLNTIRFMKGDETMTGDDKIETPEDDTPIIELADESLSDVHGGITLDNGLTFRAKLSDGVNNDTIFAGLSDDNVIGSGPRIVKKR